jgi:hypothetical protein
MNTVSKVGGQAGTTRTDRMAKRNSPTLLVHFFPIQI